MNRRLRRSHEPRAEQRAFGAKRESGRQTAAIGDTAGGEHRQRRYSFHHHRHQWQRRHPADVAAGFRALRYEHIGARLRGSHRLRNFVRHVHYFAAGIVGALKIVAQILVFARPREGGDRRAGAQSDRKHILFDLEQQMIDPVGLVGALANGANLAVQRRRVECRGAERAKSAGIGDGGHQRRGGGGAHAA